MSFDIKNQLIDEIKLTLGTEEISDRQLGSIRFLPEDKMCRKVLNFYSFGWSIHKISKRLNLKRIQVQTVLKFVDYP